MSFKLSQIECIYHGDHDADNADADDADDADGGDDVVHVLPSPLASFPPGGIAWS